MRVISFDVGMKNLAYCIITIPDPPGVTSPPPSVTNFNQQSLDNLLQNLHIERWDVIDLRFEPTDAPLVAAEPAPKKTCDNDTKQAKFMFLPVMAGAATTHSHNNAKLYCLKCAEKSKYKIPSREILPLKRKPDLLSKKKLDELMDIRKQVVVTCDPGPASAATATATATTAGVKLRKADLIQEIKTTLSRDYVEPFDEGKYLNYCGGTAAAAPTTAGGGFKNQTIPMRMTWI